MLLQDWADYLDAVRLTDAHVGRVLARLMNGMRHAILALAEQGNCVIVDDGRGRRR